MRDEKRVVTLNGYEQRLMVGIYYGIALRSGRVFIRRGKIKLAYGAHNVLVRRRYLIRSVYKHIL